MGLLEAIKDAFGILDDAEDFYDRLDKITERRDRILGFILKESQGLERRLESIEEPDDVESIVKYIRSISDSSKDLKTLFVDDIKRLQRLKVKAHGLELPKLNRALTNTESSLEKALAQHGKLINKLDELNQAYKAARRSNAVRLIVKTLLGSVVSIAVSVVAYRLLNKQASDPQPIETRDTLPSIFLNSTQRRYLVDRYMEAGLSSVQAERAIDEVLLTGNAPSWWSDIPRR